MREHQPELDHDENIQEIIKRALSGKVYFDKSDPIRVIPHPDEKVEGFLADAKKFGGTIQVVSAALPGTYEVSCVQMNSSGEIREEYFRRGDVTLAALQDVVGEAWEAGYKETGHEHDQYSADPHKPSSPSSEKRRRAGEWPYLDAKGKK